MNSMNAKVTKNIKVATKENTPRIKGEFKLFTPIIAFCQVVKDMVSSPTINIDEKECTKQDFVQLGEDMEIAEALSKGIEAESILQEATKKKINKINSGIRKDTKVVTREDTQKIEELGEDELDR